MVYELYSVHDRNKDKPKNMLEFNRLSKTPANSGNTGVSRIV